MLSLCSHSIDLRLDARVGRRDAGTGKSDPDPTPTPAVSASTTDGATQPTSTEELQLVWPDATTMLVEILLAIF